MPGLPQISAQYFSILYSLQLVRVHDFSCSHFLADRALDIGAVALDGRRDFPGSRCVEPSNILSENATKVGLPQLRPLAGR